jgi:hypothetical protein
MTLHGTLLLTVGVCVLGVSSVPGFAQTHTVRGAEQADASRDAVRVYVASRSADAAPAGPAPNLTVSSLFASVVDEMLRRSPTFRRQCQRLAAATGSSVTIQAATSMREGMAAWTTITRDAGERLQASVFVPLSARTAELIAHELEHVIEQLDGIPLGDMSRIRDSGVRQCDCASEATYETVRAIRIGRQVADEMTMVTVAARRLVRNW